MVVSNPLSNAEIPVSGLTDIMDTTLLHGGAPKVDGSSCQPSGGTFQCTVASGYVTVSGFTLGYPGDPNGYATSHTLTYYTVVGGKDVQCNGVSNTATVVVGGQAPETSAPIAMTACDAGLGLENWWSYAAGQVDPAQTAQVNVANGNAVVQALDSTPIQSHGQFDFVLRRTYNSQDSAGAATTDVNGKNGGGNGNGIGKNLPQGFGDGWQLNIGDIGMSSAGPGLGSSLGLLVPNNESPNSQSSVTFIDADGTRHVYQFNGLAANGIDITNQSGTNGLLHSLYPHALHLDTNSHGGNRFSSLCVDESFTTPPGMHLSLYRYMETDNACSTSSGTNLTPATLGFEAVKPDGTRYEFSWDGHLLDMQDAAGNTLTYSWANDATSQAWNKQGLGALQSISDSAGRAFMFSYGTNETDVTDPAGRQTRYLFDTATPQHLTEVANPDGSSENYGYGGCGGTADQLCTITDQPRNTTFRFTYTTAAVSGSLPGYYPWVASMTDRSGNTTTMSYANATLTTTPWTTADKGGERTLYANIDSSGRVGEMDQGTPGGEAGSVTPLEQTSYTWDAAGSTCEQPDNAVNNNLCSVTRHAGGTTPDEQTSFIYNPEGRILDKRQTVAPGSTIDTTFGYHAQIVDAAGSGALNVHCWDDSVAGSGNVTSAADTSGNCLGGSTRIDQTTLYELSDPTQQLTPRGNQPGSNVSAYLTTYLTDNNSSISPNYTPNFGSSTTQICATPSTPASNTGKLCELEAPSFDNGAHSHSITDYTYDGYGQKNSMTTPKAVAESGGSSTYTYFPDSAKDFSNHTSTGGWLQGVTDPTGAFVAFGYDQAGDVVRDWSRNATAGLLLSSFPGAVSQPPSSAYQQTLYASSVTASPWRYVLSSRDPLGNVTAYTVDADGNQLTIAPPRGVAIASSAYTITQGFDGNDNLVCSLKPVEAGGGACATFYTGSSALSMSPAPPSRATVKTYDALNNNTLVEDSEGGYVGYSYDAANRLTKTLTTRGPTSTTSVANCVDSATLTTPMPSGQEVCVSSQGYDMVGNVVQSQDAAGQTTSITYDGLHRLLFKQQPRNAGGPGYVYTGYQYNADSQVQAVCSPRQYSEGGLSATSGSCSSSDSNLNYTTVNAYDVAGRLSTVTTHRDWTMPDGTGPTTLTTTTTYDGDGNKKSVSDPGTYTTNYTFNVLDRMTSMAVPRDHNTTYETTTDTYDPSGNTLSQTAPNGSITAYGYDAADRLIDTVTGSSSTVAANAGTASSDGGANVRTRNVYDPDGHVIGIYGPGAFTSSVTSPNASYLLRKDYDLDGRPVGQISPRYDTSAGHTDTGVASQQSAQCTTTVPAYPNGQSWGLASYTAGTGVCVSTVAYDPAGVTNPVTGNNLDIVQLQLPTTTGSDSHPYVVYDSSEDHLPSAVTAPDPRSSTGARVTVATTAFDADGRTALGTDANGVQTSTSYTSDGLTYQVTVGTTGSHTTTYGYNANGNTTSINDGVSGQTTTTAFSSDGKDTKVTDGAGGVTADFYNEVNRTEKVFSPDAYTSGGTAYTNPAYTGSNNYGAPTVNTYTGDWLLGRQLSPVTVSSASGPTLQQQIDDTYDGSGLKTQQTTSKWVSGTVTAIGSLNFTYYNDNRPKVETGHDGTSTITDQYDPAGSTTSVAYYNSSTATTVTNTAGYYLDELTRTVGDGTASSNRAQSYGYDGLGSLAGRNDATGTGTSLETTTYSYTDAENLSQMVSGAESGATTNWTYDAGARPTQQTDNAAGTGPVLKWNYASGDGTLTSETYGSSSQAQGGWCYTYNAAFQVTSAQFGNGTSGCTSSGNVTMSYGYDPAGRLNSFTNAGSSLHCTTACSITHDKDGNRLAYTDPASGTLTNYCYQAGNSISYQTTTSGSCSTTPPAGSGVYNYTAGFDQLSSIAIASPSITVSSYCYDAFGRMNVELQNASYSCTGSAPAGASLYGYDGLDRQITHRDPNASTTSSVHYDGMSSTAVLEDFTASGTAKEVSYALTPGGSHSGLMYVGSASSVQYLAADRSGNVSAVFGAGTTPTCGQLYDPYGSVLGSSVVPVPGATTCSQTTSTNTGGNTPNSLYYSDNRKDPGSGTYQLGSRTYDPSKSSFLTPDSYDNGPGNADAALVEDPLTADRYNYVNGDPVNLVDPNGHRACADQDCYVYAVVHPGVVTQPSAIHMQRGGVIAEETAFHRSQYIDRKYNSDLATAREWAREDLNQLHACGRMVGNPCSSEVWQNDFVAGSCDLASCIGGFVANHKLDTLLTLGTLAVQWIPGVGEAADAATEAQFASEAAQAAEDAAGLATDATIGLGTEEGGFSSFSAAKNALGSPGEGNVYDHIVEQSQIGRSGFSSAQINNAENLNPVLSELNQIKANYYSSIRPFTGGQTVRDWLNGQSFESQWKFGMGVTEDIWNGVIR